MHIYRGQRAVMEAAGRSRISGRLAAMESDESRHLARFELMLTEAQVRPTLLAPLWRAAGFALGVGTALMGERAAHACTEAVETVIEGHYAGQVSELEGREPALAAELSQFRDEELAHRETARAEGAREAPGYPLLAAAIQAGCRAASRVAERL